MKILFAHQGLRSFVEKDLDILRLAYEVRQVELRGRKGLGGQFLPTVTQMWRGVQWSDLTFSWFGKLHAFFAVLFSKIAGKKAVVVAGGDDVANCIVGGKRYGLCADPVGKWFAYFTFRQADLVIAVSEYNRHETITNTGVMPGRIVLVPHGFDAKVIRRPTSVRRNGTVSTVADISKENYARKGLRLFAEAASLLPETQFRLIGPDVEGMVPALRNTASPNVEIVGELYGEALLSALSRSSVYVQASEWESFGCSLAEAMLCECIPVVSRRTAIPEVVGDSGYYVDRLEPAALAQKISEALRAPADAGARARQRIMDNFPLEKRRQGLLAALETLEKK